jgi:enoyl-CoA hydratase/carnithine racemase
MDQLILERKGRVLAVTNSDPATRNSMNWGFYDGFREVVEAAAVDREVGAIVLTGAEGFFCSGGNVNGLKERTEADYPTRRSSVERLHRMILAMRACPKPIIAAVEGGAAGAGASLAAACDLVVAVRDAYFSVAYVKIGLTPDGGVTAFLGHAIPRQLLAEMVFTGDRIPAERLHGLGMVNRLTETGQALTAALELAERLADGPVEALGVGKRLIDQARLNTLEEQLDLEADGIAAAIGRAEGREGITAFLEKRKPDFRGLE